MVLAVQRPLVPFGVVSDWKREILIFLVTWLLMLWPVAINRAPFYASDSASYLRGGELGFNTGVMMVDRWLRPPQPSHTTDPTKIVAVAISKSGGARSAIYSVTAYLLRAPGNSLLALILVQAAAVAFMLCFLRRMIAPQSPLWVSLTAGAAVAILTSAAWSTAYAMPDILAGIMICAALLLTVFFDRIGTSLRIALVLSIAFCITAHGGNLLIAIPTLLAGGFASSRLKIDFGGTLGRTAWLASPIVLAVVAMLGTSYVAFGELSLSPKRYPILLARSVADGPGAWYLHDHCATDQYAICEVFGRDPPRSVHEFLWGENGVRNRATAEQMDRIRSEETKIVRQATFAYPIAQIGQSATNALMQFFEFWPRELEFGVRLVGSREDLMSINPDLPVLKTIGKLLVYASFIGSILFLVLIRRRLLSSEVAALAVVAAGLLSNAAVCGVLSGVAGRYQGRVAWVLAAVAVMILLRVRGSRYGDASIAKVTPA